MDRKLERTCFPRSGYCERGCFHPHLHCVVPGGGISPDGARWIPCRPNGFLPVKVLSRLFRRSFLKYLQETFDAGKLQFFSSLQALQDPQAFTDHLDLVRDVDWVVYAKPPFAGPQQVVEYVGRYTHRVAISNHRIVDIEDGQVKFKWRDYRDNNQQKTLPLSADEFTRRFLPHVLPSGFHRIRYYGFLGNRHRKEKLERCRQLLGMAPPKESSAEPAPPEDYRDRYERLTGRSLRECPVCHRGRMITVEALPHVRSSPTIKDTSLSIVCQSKSLPPRTRHSRVNGVVLLHGPQNTVRPAKNSKFCPARSRTRHRITAHHARPCHYLPPILPTLPPTHQAKPIGHAPCSGLVLCIFSSPARLDYISSPLTPAVATPPS